jgi:adenylate kinase family enzyme
MSHAPRLIVIRGNSGSGKGTVAKRIREVCGGRIAIVEQDYLRRFILKEKESKGTDNIGLIRQTVVYALEHGYDVILEGILVFHRYGEMLKELAQAYPHSHFFYLDVSLEETLRRHMTKPNCNEFGEKEIREWYVPHDVTGFPGEVIIPESSSIEETVQTICEHAGLRPHQEEG